MNRGLRTPLSTPTHMSERVPAHRRRWVLLVIASFAACAWASPALGVQAEVRIDSVPGSTVLEGAGGATTPASFVVSLVGDPVANETYTVDFSTADAGASGGLDYTGVAPTVVSCSDPTTCVMFGPPPLNYDPKTISVDVLDDALDENTEQFDVTLGNAVPPALDPLFAIEVGGRTTQGTILDDDAAPTITITPAAQNVAESVAIDALFDVNLTAPSGKTVTVNYTTANGTATAGSDYTTTAATLTFAPGDTTKPVTVPILADALDEADETFTLSASSPNTNATGTPSATATILDDDLPPTLTITTPVSVTEGTDLVGVATTPATFVVTLSAPSGRPISVPFSTTPGTAVSVATATSPVDFAAVTASSLDFAPGNVTPTTPLTIQVAQDTVDEQALAETFTVSLGNPTNATLVGTGVATGNITDDDDPPRVSVNDIMPLEGNVGSTLPTFTVSLTNQSFQPVTVTFATADGTATAAADYTAAAPGAQVTVPSMTLSTTLPIQVFGDVLDEADLDTASVNLTGVLGGSLVGVGADPLGQLNIADDDVPPTVNFVPASTETHPEGNSGVVIPDSIKNVVIQLNAPSGRNLSVTWETADIPLFAPNGTVGVDYVGVPATAVVFTPGQTSKNLPVAVIGDTNAQEGSESIGLQLSAPVNVVLPVTPTKQVLILEDDVANQPPFPINDTLTVNRNAPGTINVRTNDLDPNGDAMFVAGNDPAAHGVASCQFTGVCAYTPNSGYSGPDAFTYTLSDGRSTATGTVNITVVNATPIANPDVLVTGQATPGAVNVLANDTDPDGGTLSVASAANGAHGTVACGAGTCNYVPAGGFIGADQFTYTLKDNDGATAVGTVSVTVAKGKPLTITASASGAKSRKGAKNGYTITIRNPNPGPVTLTSVSVCIPKGFSYTAGSVAGPLKKIPAKGACDAGKAKLTWAKKVSVPANGFVTLRFKVNVGGALTTAKVTVTAKAADGFAVTPLTKPAAPIKVTAQLSHGAK